jgi:EmrB/QacA subfamily drug resistance transporter
MQLKSQGKGWNWWILVAVGASSFMGALDGSVVNTILPVIREAFGSGVAAIEWVLVVYLLVVSSLLLTFGRLGDLRGHKMVFLGGMAVFVSSSALCGLASSTEMLIGFRALQALGAAMLLSNSPAILTGNFPASMRGRVLGLSATMTYLGLTIGPSLGGWLSEQFSWRAVFYINVPVGALAFLLSLVSIPADSAFQKKEGFDFAGAVTFMAGLVLLLLALNEGHAWGWLSPAILGLLAAAIVLLVVFVRLESQRPAPMLDLSLFRSRLFSASVVSAVCNYIVLYSILFLLPFYLIQGRGLNPAQAGLLLTAQPVVMVVAAPLSGALSDRIGSRLLATLGMLILTVGAYLLSRLGPASPFSAVALGLAISGLGTGIFISPNTSALLGAAPAQRQGIASGIMATSRNVGMAVGVGVAGAIFTTILARQGSGGLVPAVSAGMLVAAGVALLSSLTSAERGEEKKLP